MQSLVGGLEHGFLFSITYMGCHPNPIDELHHFSRWLLHQPEMVPHSSPRWFVSRGVPQVIQDPP